MLDKTAVYRHTTWIAGAATGAGWCVWPGSSVHSCRLAAPWLLWSTLPSLSCGTGLACTAVALLKASDSALLDLHQ